MVLWSWGRSWGGDCRNQDRMEVAHRLIPPLMTKGAKGGLIVIAGGKTGSP